MLDTFLFDLDGTLLAVDSFLFMDAYFKEMQIAFEDIVEPVKMNEYIEACYKAMLANPGIQTNQEVFIQNFGKLVGGDLELLIRRFDEFYDNGYINNRKLVAEIPIMIDSIKVLKEKGYKLVVVTNPIYPIKAIHHRLCWAGLNPEDFFYICSYEHNHYCKPSVLLFEEVIQDIGKAPEQCILVGNDIQEDIIASKLGIQTYLIANYLINRTGEDFECTYRGIFEDFFRFVKELQYIK